MRSHQNPHAAPKGAFRDVCCAPNCEAPALPMLRIPMCATCARDLAYQYAAERSAVLAPAAEQTAEEAMRVAEGRIGVRGVVYFARLGNRIKIGFSADLAQRMTVIPHEEVLGTAPGYLDDERRCHAAFAHLRVTGEWFEDTPELRRFIADIVSRNGGSQ